MKYVNAVVLCLLIGCAAPAKPQLRTADGTPIISEPEWYHIYPHTKRLLYVRDPRTNICFATVWIGGGNGGPAMATVDCEKVRKYVIDLKE